MLLTYLHCFGPEQQKPDLCIIPDKPDQFSVPVRIDSLINTEAAIHRLGPIEAITVEIDPSDKGIVIAPLKPAKFFLTPDVHDQPGVSVRKVKIFKGADGRYATFYLMDRHEEGQWQPWEPLKRRQG